MHLPKAISLSFRRTLPLEEEKKYRLSNTVMGKRRIKLSVYCRVRTRKTSITYPGELVVPENRINRFPNSGTWGSMVDGNWKPVWTWPLRMQMHERKSLKGGNLYQIWRPHFKHFEGELKLSICSLNTYL